MGLTVQDNRRFECLPSQPFFLLLFVFFGGLSVLHLPSHFFKLNIGNLCV